MLVAIHYIYTHTHAQQTRKSNGGVSDRARKDAVTQGLGEQDTAVLVELLDVLTLTMTACGAGLPCGSLNCG